MLGSMPTVTGKRVSEDSALKFTAILAATRVISETLATLPCNLLERVDERTSRVATEKSLQRIVHDAPNPEMDSMCYTDSQTQFTVNWGNDYSEIQRNTDGAIVALWPIHPSRIPLSNITRNPQEGYRGWEDITAGQPGEIVYWVKNDDGSVTPIPAEDMFHVPGVLSSNGITGQSMIRLVANAVGIGLSTEEHAGALFKNGAVTNMVIKSAKTVGKETAERLRTQWQQSFGSVGNHYKTLLLEDGMEPVPISMNAEETQLILARQFSVTEIARAYRLPPHFLADLTRSTNNNIEHQALEFVIYAMMPWIVRREKAMNRQLLTDEEKQRFYFKYNVMGLLRGAHAARSAFYTALFQMGVLSPNDIRELEDMNPVEGGDQRFVPGNNLIPLEKATELAEVQIEKTEAEIEKIKRPDPVPAAPAQPPANLIRELVRLECRDASEAVIERINSSDEESRARDAELARGQDELKTVTATNKTEIEHILTAHAETVNAAVAPIAPLAQQLTTTSELARNAFALIETAITSHAEATAQHAAILEQLPQKLVEPLTDLAKTVATNSEAAKTAIFEHISAQNEAFVSQVEAIPQLVSAAVAPIAEKMDANEKTLREHGDAERDATVEMIVKQAQATREDVAQQVAPITEKLDAVPQIVQQTVDALAKQAAEARNTAETDEIAAKQAEIDRKAAEIDEKLASERKTTERLLAFALQRGIDRLVGREANAIAGAREEPRGFTEWRTGFYKTFLRLFEHELDGFVPEFELCGVTIDPRWGADRYVGASIADLKTLDDTAADNHYDRLKAATDNFVKVIWTDRSKTLADELISRGRRLFDEKKEQKCTN